MRADEYVYLSFLEAFLYVINLLCGFEAAHIFNVARKVSEAGLEGLVMLQ